MKQQRIVGRLAIAGCVLALFMAVSAYGGSLQESAARMAASTTASVVEGQDGYLFLREELQHLAAGKFWGEQAKEASRSRKKQYSDPLPAILDYHQQLQKRGISLFLMPVPPKALVYPDKLDPSLSLESTEDDRRLYAEFYQLLAEKGVQVIDLLPELVAARKGEKTEGQPFYCRTDTHFSGAGMAFFARAAAERIRSLPWYKEYSPQQYSREKRHITITGDLARMSGKKNGVEPEKLELTFITDASGELLQSDPSSPVVLLGDSHTLVYSAGGDLYARGAGLFDLLSAELGFPLDLLGVRGSGVTPARINFYQRSKKESRYLDTKKAVIWCFTARDFTGTGGWRQIPVAP